MTVNDTLDVFVIRQDLLSYIPTLVPPHHFSPPSMTPSQEAHHLLGQRKQTYVVYCFFWQGRKANSLRAWRSYRSSPPLPDFLFFCFFNSTYLCRWPARTCLFATTILLCHWAISWVFFPCWGMRRGEGRFISNATLSVWQEREALKVMLHRYIRQQHHIGVFCWVRRGRSEDRL